MNSVKINVPKVDKRIRNTKRYKVEFFLLQIRLVILAPFKFLYIMFKNAYKNPIVDFISIVGGIGVCEYFIWLMFPFQGKTAVVFIILSLLNVSVGATIFNACVDYICKFFIGLLNYPNYIYDKIREIIRTEKDDYSIGLDEGAKVGINQFIKKNKQEKEFTFKG